MQNSQNVSGSHIEKLMHLIQDVPVAMLTTVGADGVLRSRPMSPANAGPDDELWFFTNCDGQKFEDVLANAHVNVSYSDPARHKFVSVSGHAEIVFDREKAANLWTEMAKTWFPKGPADTNLALINVKITDTEYWDVKLGMMIQLLAVAKAAISGESPGLKLAEHEKISGDEIRGLSQ